MNTRLQSFWFLCQCLALSQDIETIERLRNEIRADLVDWESIVQIADQQLVSPALWTSLMNKGLHEDVPDKFKYYLSGLHNLNLQRNCLIKKQAEEIIMGLNSVGIEPILLKGAALLFTNVFSDNGARILADLDIMVLSTEAEASLQALSSIGYRLLYPDAPWSSWCQHLPPMIREGDLAAIELHTQLVNMNDDIMVLTATDCFKESQTIQTNLVSFKVLSISHFIIHNIIHGEIHHRYFNSGTISLRRLLDFAVTSASQPHTINWKSIEHKMTENGIRFIYWSYLHMAFTLLNALVPYAFGPYIRNKNDINYGFDFLTFLESSGQRDIFSVFRDDTHGHSQLFIDSGPGFNESESVMIHDAMHKPSLVFSLKDFDTIKSLRFDPLDGPCVIEILDAKLITENGDSIPLTIQTTNAMHKKDNKFFFSTNDPIILMDFDFQGEVISAVEIRLNYLVVGYLALKECMAFQENLVSDLRCQIAATDQAIAERSGEIASLKQAVVDRDIHVEGLLRSRSWRLTAPLRFMNQQCKRVKRLLFGGPGK